MIFKTDSILTDNYKKMKIRVDHHCDRCISLTLTGFHFLHKINHTYQLYMLRYFRIAILEEAVLLKTKDPNEAAQILKISLRGSISHTKQTESRT